MHLETAMGQCVLRWSILFPFLLCSRHPPPCPDVIRCHKMSPDFISCHQLLSDVISCHPPPCPDEPGVNWRHRLHGRDQLVLYLTIHDISGTFTSWQKSFIVVFSLLMQSDILNVNILQERKKCIKGFPFFLYLLRKFWHKYNKTFCGHTWRDGDISKLWLQDTGPHLWTSRWGRRISAHCSIFVKCRTSDRGAKGLAAPCGWFGT